MKPEANTETNHRSVSGNPTPQPVRGEKRKIGLSGLILIAFLLGMGTGLFFGESASVLQIIGRVFFQLLQMTILPYITFSLISNLGSLSPAAAKAITARTGWVLGLSWVMVLLLVLAASLALPELESASFFSTSDVTPPESADLLGLFIPSNPFRALSNNFVPAVVLFSVALGVALMGIGGKEPVLDQLKVITKALARISGTVAKLTPIGVFSVTASAAGTLTLEDLGRIQAYLILLVGMALLLVFWIFPLVLSLLTELRYRDIFGRLSDALIVAFSTDSVFIALPLISEAAGSLLEKSRQDAREKTQSFDVVLPVIFSFPHAGKLLLLLFVVFAAWFSGSPLAALGFPPFAVAGLFSLFGSSSTAILFLDFFCVWCDAPLRRRLVIRSASQRNSFEVEASTETAGRHLDPFVSVSGRNSRVSPFQAEWRLRKGQGYCGHETYPPNGSRGCTPGSHTRACGRP